MNVVMENSVFCDYCDKDKRNGHKREELGILKSISQGVVDRAVCPACQKPGLMITQYKNKAARIFVIEPNNAHEVTPSFFRWPVDWPEIPNPFMFTFDI